MVTLTLVPRENEGLAEHHQSLYCKLQEGETSQSVEERRNGVFLSLRAWSFKLGSTFCIAKAATHQTRSPCPWWFSSLVFSALPTHCAVRRSFRTGPRRSTLIGRHHPVPTSRSRFSQWHLEIGSLLGGRTDSHEIRRSTFSQWHLISKESEASTWTGEPRIAL
jgi:hypothetical protein